MIPQLWKRFFNFTEWRTLHPHLNDLDAERLYSMELRLFQNYENEIRNLIQTRQTKLVNQIDTLSSDISNILNVNNLVDVYGSSAAEVPPSGLIIEGDEVVYIVTEDDNIINIEN
jgi:hypothetical protein